MKTELIRGDVFRISDAPRLDPITVMVWNPVRGCGMLTVQCFGQAWSAWWGAMGDHTVETFLLNVVDADYVTNSLFRGVDGVITKASTRSTHYAYLQRIVGAVLEAMRHREMWGGAA